MACDMILIFHVPLFAAWLREVMNNKVRVQMVIDAPDDLEQLQSPPGLKQAEMHAHEIYEKTQKIHVTSKAGSDLYSERGEYVVLSQYGMADELGRFDHWAVGLIHAFPNEESSLGTVVIQPGDIIILPCCRYVVDPVRLTIDEGHVTEIEGGLDAALMREWLKDGEEFNGDRDPYAVSHVGWGMNPQCRWDSIALFGDAPERSRAASRCFPGNFLFSTGPNSQGGGKRTARGHYDVPMRNCTIALNTGATDIGQGSDTVLAQICAESLKVPLSQVTVASPDTDGSPCNWGTTASRVGNLHDGSRRGGGFARGGESDQAARGGNVAV